MKNVKCIFSACALFLICNIANATQEYNVVLKHSVGGAILLLPEPNLGNLKPVCDAIGNSKAIVVSEKKEGYETWLKVKVVNGNCMGKVGWTLAQHVQLS